MSTRFEILKNGERVCISGINGDGVLSVGVTYVKHPGKEPSFDLGVGGLGMFDGSMDRQHHADWPSTEITTGDEITIRILAPGEFDEPCGKTCSPKKSIDDAELGTINYYINSWDADIAFDVAPFQSAHIHFGADENGPSEHQRRLLRDLRDRHVELWPNIRSALVKCHPEIQTPDELDLRLNLILASTLSKTQNRSS